MAQKSNSGIVPSGAGEMQGEVLEHAMFHRLMRDLKLRAEVDNSNAGGDAAAMRTVEEIFAAEESGDEEAIWNAGEFANIGGRDLVDVEQRVYSIQVKSSDREEIDSAFMDDNGQKYYLLVNSKRLDNGAEIVWNTSAPDVLAKLLAFERTGKLPLECKIVGIKLGGARVYLRLKPVPKRVVS